MTFKRTCLLLGLLVWVGSLDARPAGPVMGPSLVDSHAVLEAALNRPPAPSADTAKRVDDLLGRMTLREKVGQMTQLEIGMISDGKGAGLRVNPSKLRKAVVDYGVGSILNVNDEALTAARWREITSEIQASAAGTRLKIPVLYGLDSIHGANYVAGATLFPQPLGMAATWNPDRVREASRVTASESRAAGVPWTFAPILDLGRQVLWPRLYETFGEDPYLATVMGVAAVRGYQGDDLSSGSAVAACLKHYVGYSLPTTGHDRTPALIPESTLREMFLPPFAGAIRAGARSVMINSGEVNGVPGHVNGFLLKDVLRRELGFTGLVVSDWEDIKKLVSIHRVAATEKEATRRAVLAGIDMSMVPNDYSFSDLLIELVEEGAVPAARIDEAVSRVLALKFELGLFDDAQKGVRSNPEPGSADARRLALAAAQESLVLVKNSDAVLPLSPRGRVLVTGPTADSLPSLNNGWTLTWQGDREALYPKDRATILGAVRARLGAPRVTHVPGATYDKEVDVAAAARAAREAEVVILCLGENSYAETPGNVDDLTLPEAQLRLAEAVTASGTPVILVLVEGRPRVVSRIESGAKAVLIALNPGLEGGQAVADVLFGDVDPSGRLPITYPRYPNALRTYDHKAFEEQDQSFGLKAYTPQWEFGHGLSYTRFSYSGLTVSPETVGRPAAVDVAVTVSNSGPREGAEVVQLYVSDHVASLTPPVKRLKRFAKLRLRPGENQVVKFRLTEDDLSFVGADGRPVVEPGDFTVSVGGLKRPFVLR